MAVSLRRFDAAAYALVGKHRSKSPEALRSELVALAQVAKLDGIQAQLSARDIDTLATEVPSWIARMRRQVVKGMPRPPSLGPEHVLSGERLEAAAREPWRAVRIALKHHPSLTAEGLFEARKSELFRIYGSKNPAEFFASLSAQVTEMTKLARVTKFRPATLGDLDARLQHVIRNVGQSVTVRTPELVTALKSLRGALAHWPELAGIKAAVSAIQLPSALEAVDAVRAAPESPLPQVRHAVIVGAGPAGLAAAIELASQGVRVDLVDARDPWHFTRPVQMVLKQHAVDQLKHLGVFEAIEPHLSAIVYDVDETPNSYNVESVSGGRPPDPHRKTRSGEIFASSRSLYSGTLNVIEAALFKKCLELGVRPISNATIGFGKVRGSGPTARRAVWFQRGIANGPRFEAHGRRFALGTPDLVLVAEGSRSQRRRTFRVPWDKDDAPKKRGLAGLVRVDLGSTTHTWSESDREAKDIVISVGHATSGATWTLAEVPDDQRISSKDEAARFFLKRASHALKTPLERKDLLFGGTALFQFENRSVRRAAFAVSERQAILAIGDSKGIGSPTIGLGMQYGISVDALAVGRFIENVPAFGFKQSAAIFNATTRDNLHAWHKRWPSRPKAGKNLFTMC